MSSVPWPWPEENGVDAARAAATDGAGEVYDEQTIAVFEILRRWFFGMEDGTAAFWHPDPDFVRANGQPLTEEQVNHVVERALDAYLNDGPQVNYARGRRGFEFDAGPDFSRLAYPQRLAMVQELCRVLEG